MKFFKWVKHRLTHKFNHFRLSHLIDVLKEHGLALVIIIVIWEIIEDVGFPLLFIWLGTHVHPLFLVGAPVSWLLCLHWIAVPITWGWWIKIKKKDK